MKNIENEKIFDIIDKSITFSIDNKFERQPS